MPTPPIPRRILLAALCALAIVPFFHWGSPSGHDFEFHMNLWMEALAQWKHGTLYPRWAALAYWGYGEPIYIFYPPASWMLGATLGALLPWKLVPGVYCWLALIFAAFAMYKLASRWLTPPDALFAAAFYALNPYHLLILYWRSAYAELLAAGLLPFLFLAVGHLNEKSFRPALWLTAILAAAWLTNIPAAVMIHYSAAGLALLLAIREKSIRPLLRTGIAVLLAAALASFYLVPAIYEQHWVNLDQVLSPGVRPIDNFLFTPTTDPDHNRFNLLVSFVALSEIAVLAAAVVFSGRNRRRSPPWLALAAWGTFAAFLMLSVSNIFWEHLPKLRFVQLPFRWLLVMNAALALLLTIATLAPTRARWITRAAVCAFLLAVIVISGHRTQPPWWETADDIADMRQSILDGSGYEGVDEYVPAGADPYELNRDLPLLSDSTGLPVKATILSWTATERHFQVYAAEPQDLTVRLFRYPVWATTVNGRPVETTATDVTRLLVVPLAAGENDVRIVFLRTGDRLIGAAFSFLSLIVFAFAWNKARRVQPTATNTTNSAAPRTVLVATSNPGKLRDLAGAAAAHAVTIASLPGFSSLPPVIEDGDTFEANARKKAEQYSLAAPGQLVLADDSGLEVDALNGAPGVHSARYAAPDVLNQPPHAAGTDTDDEANNARLLRELAALPESPRSARFVCVLAAARDGQTLATFRGTAEGVILAAPRGHNGFGYDPLFYFPAVQKTFAELSAEEKAQYSHRGAAFRAFLAWCDRNL